MEEAVGGQFDAIGQMERDLVVSLGLLPDAFLIDIGCGSGRLAVQLARFLQGDYLGTDVVPELLDHARKLVNKPNWRFQLCADLQIPADDGAADMVCFFSVFTHLLHQETFCYLREARRVLRPGGKIVFSFIEFSDPGHWVAFEDMLNRMGSERHVDQFMSRDGIRVWARHLDLQVQAIFSGYIPHIPLSRPVMLGTHEYKTVGTLGQSVAVLGR
jgi:ubiquinone/menaquinone biosynthesis C-methylase UbiE